MQACTRTVPYPYRPPANRTVPAGPSQYGTDTAGHLVARRAIIRAREDKDPFVTTTERPDVHQRTRWQDWLGGFFSSSVGLKWLMAITGIGCCCTCSPT